MYSMGIEIDTPEERMKGFEISDEIKGWEIYQKESGEGKAITGIADRFYIEVEAIDPDDSGYCKKILQDEIDIDELAEL